MTEETTWIGGQLTSQAVPRTNIRGSSHSDAPEAIDSFVRVSGSTTGIISL